MAEGSIPVDLFNPGQVFACLGFMEAAEILLGGVEAAFDWSVPMGTRFRLRAAGSESPFAHVLGFIASADVVALAPDSSASSAKWIKTWGAVEALESGAPYPSADPASPATFMAVLRSGTVNLPIDHWCDSTKQCDAVKFWGGAGGYPGAALTRDALRLVRDRCASAHDDPFSLAAPQSSSFRLDWRRDYIPIDTGFSLNAHKGTIETVGYPLVELLAALGLGRARPTRLERLAYRYAVIGLAIASSPIWYPASFLRAALSGAGLATFPSRRFHMSLGSPSKYERSITTVIEEIDP